jgi:hypothetical protein
VCSLLRCGAVVCKLPNDSTARKLGLHAIAHANALIHTWLCLPLLLLRRLRVVFEQLVSYWQTVVGDCQRLMPAAAGGRAGSRAQQQQQQQSQTLPDWESPQVRRQHVLSLCHTIQQPDMFTSKPSLVHRRCISAGQPHGAASTYRVPLAAM